MQFKTLLTVALATMVYAKNVLDIDQILSQPWNPTSIIPTDFFKETINNLLSAENHPQVSSDDLNQAVGTQSFDVDGTKYLEIFEIKDEYPQILEKLNQHRDDNDKITGEQLDNVINVYLLKLESEAKSHNLYHKLVQLSGDQQVVSLESFKEALQAEAAQFQPLLDAINRYTNDKREAKNVISLADYKFELPEQSNEKRENEAEEHSLKTLMAAKYLDKRGQASHKNRLQHLKLAKYNDKREAKNIFDLAQLQADLDNNNHEKREAKNVYNLAQLQAGIDDETNNDKREAKNVYNLAQLQAGLDDEVKDKREPKNVLNLAQLQADIDNDNNHEKREAKNVYNLAQLQAGVDDETNDKREAKNVYNLAQLQDAVNEENGKREPKNIIDLSAVLTDLDKPGKRDAKNVFNFAELAKLETKPGKREYTLADVSAIIDLINQRQQVLSQSSGPVLQEVLPQMRDISIFTRMIRDNAGIEAMTESRDQALLILAPSDEAIAKLSQKPWEFPTPVVGDKSDAIAAENLDSFLKGHIVEEFLSSLSTEGVDAWLMNGKPLTITKQADGKVLVNYEDRHVAVRDLKQEANGYVLVLDECLVQP
ncbi:hypothetical protein DIURU_000923 [Diutina rugosa]|uniref:FAS1 domain-containing protein n=1 Tax=Diutina rugosa TaxID=5481 RepID=A0A642UVW7_DIURU|nr:uncharacterized protein DIURU_000923 [Diutina rugosa]KAA8906762.1 hypothetical protein DIURU_000923 [Diutina rugosa]